MDYWHRFSQLNPAAWPWQFGQRSRNSTRSIRVAGPAAAGCDVQGLWEQWRKLRRPEPSIGSYVLPYVLLGHGSGCLVCPWSGWLHQAPLPALPETLGIVPYSFNKTLCCFTNPDWCISFFFFFLAEISGNILKCEISQVVLVKWKLAWCLLRNENSEAIWQEWEVKLQWSLT